MPLVAGGQVRIVWNETGGGNVVAFSKFDVRVFCHCGKEIGGLILRDRDDANIAMAQDSTVSNAMAIQATINFRIGQRGLWLEENAVGNKASRFSSAGLAEQESESDEERREDPESCPKIEHGSEALSWVFDRSENCRTHRRATRHLLC